jgi:hypothetical protein
MMVEARRAESMMEGFFYIKWYIIVRRKEEQTKK